MGEEEVLYCLLDPLSFAPQCAHDPDDHDRVQIHTESFLMMMMYYKFMQNLRSLQEEYPDDVQIHGRIQNLGSLQEELSCRAVLISCCSCIVRFSCMHGLNCMTDDDAGGESVSRACSNFCILGGVDELW